ncbi:MAG: XRE family transcriptional regulator [Sulfurimonas sp.]|nr:XRE family transcriptional regulator [Sulfurimonas sp.]
MEYKDFEVLLKSTNMNKKQFADVTGLSYQTIMNWNNINSTPPWVEPFLANYKKAKNFEKAKEIFCEMEGEENRKEE